MGSNDDNLKLSTQQRIDLLTTSKASADRPKEQGSSISVPGREQWVSMESARSVVEQWPESPKMTAEMIFAHYGAPNESTPTKLFWYRTGRR